MSRSRVALVTGVTGFLGRHVARELSETGWDVVGIGKRDTSAGTDPSLSAYYKLDYTSDSLGDVVSRHVPHACIHCAGGASVADSLIHPAVDFEAGPVTTFAVLDALRRFAPRCRLVFLSSAAVYGNPETLPIAEAQQPAPISPYGYHKLQCEQLCAEFHAVYGLPTAVVRIFSAYGAGLRKQVLWDICRRALLNPRLTLRGTGTETRDFVHSDDVAQGLRIIVERAAFVGETYNLSSGEETSIRRLAELLLGALGVDTSLQFDGVSPAGMPLNWRADISKLKALGFAPRVDIASGATSFASWFRSQEVS